jgi:hypothetical protein
MENLKVNTVSCGMTAHDAAAVNFFRLLAKMTNVVPPQQEIVWREV